MPTEDDVAVATYIRALGYFAPHKLPNGEWGALCRFILTIAIITGIDSIGGYAGRWCYRSEAEARYGLLTWSGDGDPPGNWIKYKGRGPERRNPRTCGHVLRRADGFCPECGTRP